MNATKKVRLATVHWLRESAVDMNVVPEVHSTLISACKLADADYVTVLDKKGLNIYDGTTAKIMISEKVVLRGYRTKDRLWRIPLKEKINNKTAYILLLQRPCPKDAISHLFPLPTT